MICVISNSYDASAQIIYKIGLRRGLKVFLLHTDLILDYHIDLSLDDFRIKDPAGRTFSLNASLAVYHRKPWIGGDPVEGRIPEGERSYVLAELKALVSELVAGARARGKLRLVEPNTGSRQTKFIQMMKARRYFEVPRASVRLNDGSERTNQVVKSLAAENINDTHFMYVRDVDSTKLAEGFPWFEQDKVTATHDVTAVFVDRTVFWFRNATKRGAGNLDWRQRINSAHEDEWLPAPELSRHSDDVKRLMSDLELRFGRLDFLEAFPDRLVFLEVNANGQYAWLDLEEPHPIHNFVVDRLLDPSCSIN